MIDVLLVKYCLDESSLSQWDRTISILSKQSGVNILIRDNTKDNIGLIAARVELLEKSTSEFVCFMDFDFESFEVDLNKMIQILGGSVVMAVPNSPSSWGVNDAMTCHCMVMKRRIFDSLGGFDKKFFVAYADWDLMTRIWNAGLKIERVPNTNFTHSGLSNNNPNKTKLWNKDREIYLKKWCSKFGEGKNRALISNPLNLDLGDFINKIWDKGLSVDVVKGIHNLNFWHSESNNYQHLYEVTNGLQEVRGLKEAVGNRLRVGNVFGKLNNSAVVVIPARNFAKYIEECLKSIKTQTYEDIGIVVIDDASSDNTVDIVKNTLQGIDAILIKNTERHWALFNVDRAISECCGNSESVIFLVDGDDKLIDRDAIKKMMEAHKDADVVWSSYQPSMRNLNPCSGPVDNNKPMRKQEWRASHLRSFKKFLFDSIDRLEFKDEKGNYLKATWDRAVMLPILEMVPHSKRKHVPERLYFYRIHNGNVSSTSDGFALQKHNEKLIHSRSPAKLHPRYEKTGVSVIVSCFNQAHVLPLFLESMFFQSQMPEKVIIADDGSVDESLDWIEKNAEKYPFQISYVTRKHNGYHLAGIENLAAKYVEGGRILFTNADVIHNPTSIEAHAKTIGVGGGIVKGLQEKAVSQVTLNTIRDFQLIEELCKQSPSWRANQKYIDSTDPNYNPIGVWGGNFSVPVEEFKKIGGFDADFTGWGGEENDVVLRISKNGVKVGWVKESVVYHLDHPHKKYCGQMDGSKRYLKKAYG